MTIKDLIFDVENTSKSKIQAIYKTFFPELEFKGVFYQDFLNFSGQHICSIFSAGQKQRLAHFLAYYSKAEMLISDEGFCHLDDNLKSDIINFYAEERRYSIVLMVEHDGNFLYKKELQEIRIEG